jgi:DNA-binding MarR family transcriptional regulator
MPLDKLNLYRTNNGMAQAQLVSRERGQAQRLRAGVRALVARFAISERADVACCGMTVAQAATLEILLAERELRLGALGRRLGISPSTLSRNLARLEERGLVRRRAEPGDARAFRAVLTDAGVRAAHEVERQEEAFAASILERLPARRRADLLTALDELLFAVRGATESCCPGAFEHLMVDFPRATRARAKGKA